MLKNLQLFRSWIRLLFKGNWFIHLSFDVYVDWFFIFQSPRNDLRCNYRTFSTKSEKKHGYDKRYTFIRTQGLTMVSILF